MPEPDELENPYDQCDNDDGVEQRFYGRRHRYIGVDQPKQHPGDNQYDDDFYEWHDRWFLRCLAMSYRDSYPELGKG